MEPLSTPTSKINSSPTASRTQPVENQPSILPGQNSVTTLQLVLPDLVQNTEHNRQILSLLSSRLEKGMKESVVKPTRALQSNSLLSNIPQCMQEPLKKLDGHVAQPSNPPASNIYQCIVPLETLNGHVVQSSNPPASSSPNANQLQLAQVNGSLVIPNSVDACIPQKAKVEDDSNPSSPTVSSMENIEIIGGTLLGAYIMKIKQEIKGRMDCGSNACSSTPSSSTSVPSTSGISQESGNQGVVNEDTGRQSNDGMPPVSIGECLLCGRECGGCGVSGSESEDESSLPLPPMSSVEVDSLFGKLKEQDKETPAEPASVINTKMFLHQKQALNWMINKENSNDLGPFWREYRQGEWFNEGTKQFVSERPTCIKGGILADDMGLGKTLTIIALIFTNHLNGKPMFMKKEMPNSKKRRTGTSDASEPQAKKPSLESTFHEDEEDVVIVKQVVKKREKKTVAIKKRKEQMMNRKRLIENNKNKKNLGALFRQIFLPEFLKKKKKQQDNKIKKERTGSSPDKNHIAVDVTQPTTSKAGLDITQPTTSKAGLDITKIDDEDDDSSDDVTPNHRPNKLLIANPVPSGAAKATLIICPLSVLSNWTDQICTHVNPAVKLKVYMYYGAQRIEDLKYLSGQDVVVTTYPTIANDFRSKSVSPLHKIKWLRVILDEGHMIRNKRTTLSKAVLQLEAERRWVVTGTPIQNRIDDIRTSILYLRLEPFNDNKWWKQSIANLQKEKSDLADFRLNTLIKHVSIRRLKDEKVDNLKLVELPPKQVVIQDIEMSEKERKLYDMMQLDGQSTIKRYLRHDSVLKHYANCFAILMRLRQMCLHQRLCKDVLKELQQALDQSKDDDATNDADDTNDDRGQLIKVLMEAISSGDSEECAVCLESLNDPVITPCAHVFCCACITDVLNAEGLAPKCPMCRAPVDETDLLHVPEELQRINNTEAVIDVDDDDEDEFEGSAKIKALISSLEAIRDKDPSIKSVIVSQFTSFLNIVEEYLDRHGFEYLRLDGTMRLEERLKALEDFNEPGSSATVFLLSMSAGGMGLSLTAASRVFLMDPAWNPAVEEQCFDRCHRMGQTREVIITKYIVMDSVEERMLTLQEKKRQLMSQAFGAKAQSEEDKSRTRVRDIAHLIGLRPVRPGPN